MRQNASLASSRLDLLIASTLSAMGKVSLACLISRLSLGEYYFVTINMKLFIIDVRSRVRMGDFTGVPLAEFPNVKVSYYRKYQRDEKLY